MWFWFLLIAIAVGALIGYLNGGSKADAAAGGCIGGMGCLHVLGYIVATVFSLWIVVMLFRALFG